MTGVTESSDFPVSADAAQRTSGSPAQLGGSTDITDAYVTKLDPAGSGASYSTYLGGAGNDEANGIAVDESGRAAVVGTTTTAGSGVSTNNFPATRPYEGSPNERGFSEAFATKFSPAGSAHVYSALLGGQANDYARDIALDSSGSAYVTGMTDTEDFPTVNPYQSTIQDKPTLNTIGIGDGFLTRLSAVADLALTMTAAPSPVDTGQQLTYTLTARNNGPEMAGTGVQDQLPVGVEFVTASPGCSQALGLVSCEFGQLDSGASAVRQIVVRPTLPNPALLNTAVLRNSVVDAQSANDSATATTDVRQAPAPPGTGTVPGGTTGTGTTTGTTLPGTGASQRGAGGLLGGLSAAERSRDAALRRCLVGAAGRRARRRCLARYGRRPGRVRGLRARVLSATKIVLSFRTPRSGEPGAPARSYVIKQSRRPLRGRRSFRRARSLCGGSCRLSVRRVGERVRVVITDLRPNTTYYYAVAARDNVSRRLGPRSRAVRARTR